MAGENNKVVIVTGGSSGIGRCTASALKENGCIVYEFSRRNIPMEGVTHLSVDVTDEDAVNAAVQQVIQKETKIDAANACRCRRSAACNRQPGHSGFGPAKGP